MSLPKIYSSGEVEYITDSFFISTQNDCIVYSFTVERFYSQVSSSPDSIGVINNVSSDQIIEYFFQLNEDSLGYRFDSLSDPRPKKEMLNTFLETKFSLRENLLLTDSDSLIQAQDLNKNRSREVYFRHKKTSLSDYDTIVFAYDNDLIDLDFSFSKRIEKLKKKKLASMTFIQSPIQNSANPLLKRRKEVKFEISKVEDFSFTDEIKN